MVKENIIIWMVIYMMVNGKMIKRVVMENILILEQVKNIMVNG